ncbi:hypothetical protein JIG36_33270 [Actinoplanes sp. LDG1-06]|uniref:DUF1453 domain-containing protein n=1 Tax=Paractinoplanes ovalisporus TaxID=2810368 RepID=A0ABS2AKN2_9ACTN|nr:hypothetical protein [Actinoplanes ovalisporus]MBM2620394.1 hypothetical protein [Actinoplanes ovalisporus]
MTSTTLINALIGLALVTWICSRQLRWRAADPAKMFKLPIVLGIVGLVSMSREATTIKPIDVAVLGVSAVLALASGAVMGRIARFRPSPTDSRTVETRTGWAGVGIWAALIAVRVIIDVIGHRMGSEMAVATGSILLVLAINRIAGALVISARLPHRVPAMAGR